MSNNTIGGAIGLVPQAAEPMPTPEVGQTFTLQFYPYGGLSQVHNEMYVRGGTYVEVEVKAVKTAKVVLE